MPDGADYAGETRTWRVGGMDCASCAAKVERAVARLPGVQDIQVNLMAETLTARLGPGGDAGASAVPGAYEADDDDRERGKAVNPGN